MNADRNRCRSNSLLLADEGVFTYLQARSHELFEVANRRTALAVDRVNPDSRNASTDRRNEGAIR